MYNGASPVPDTCSTYVFSQNNPSRKDNYLYFIDTLIEITEVK